MYDKKDKLFKTTRDISKWGYTGSKEELEGRADELIKRRAKLLHQLVLGRSKKNR